VLRREAVAQALETRPRPIVLSTLTAVLDMLPLMLAQAWREIYRPATVPWAAWCPAPLTWF